MIIMKKRFSIVFFVIFIFCSFFPNHLDATDDYECDQFIQNKDWNIALKCIENLKQSRPEWYYPYYLQAKIFLGLNREIDYLSSMKAALNKAVAEKELFNIYYEYSQFYYNRWKDDEDRKKAEHYCVQAKSVASEEVGQKGRLSIYYLCGKIAYKAKDFKSAEKDIKKAYDFDNKDPVLAEYYVFSLFKLGKEKEAVNILLTAPKNPTTYGLLGKYYIAIGQFKKAIKTAKTCLEIDNRALECTLVLAEGYKGEHNWEIVIATLNKAHQFANNDWRVDALTGEAYMKIGNYKEAINYLRKACSKIDYYNCEPFINLSLAYEGEFKVTKDRMYIDKALIVRKAACEICPRECFKEAGSEDESPWDLEKRLKARKSSKKKEELEINCGDPKNKNVPECIDLEYPGVFDFYTDPRWTAFFFSIR